MSPPILINVPQAQISLVKYALIQMEAIYVTAILDMYMHLFLMAGRAVKIQVNAM